MPEARGHRNRTAPPRRDSPRRAALPHIAGSDSEGRQRRAREPRPPVSHRWRSASPPVHGPEQEQPYDVYEVPVPGRRLEAEMMVGREVAADRAEQADRQEDGSDQNMEPVEPGGHVEGGRVDAFGEAERGVPVLVDLETREENAQRDCAGEPLDQAAAIVLEQR